MKKYPIWQQSSPGYREINDKDVINKLWKTLLELYISTLIIHWSTDDYQVHLITDKLYKKLIKKIDKLSEIINDSECLKAKNLTLDINFDEYIDFLDSVANEINQENVIEDRAINNILDEIQTEIRKYSKMLKMAPEY